MIQTTRARRFAPLSLSIALTLGVAACATDDVGSGSEFATDSFVSPTDHGQLHFGVENPAEFTASSRFHAWTFSLTGPAAIDLSTELHTVNLDTVMYLYRRTEAGWGSYIDKNDDHEGLLASRIVGSYEAGEYMLKVKATKAAMLGSFGVLGSCSGDGCPVIDAGACASDGPATLPAATGYSPSCDAKLAAIVTTPTSPAPSECAGAFEERVVQYYKDYWNGVSSYEDLTLGEDVTPSVEIQFHAGAGVVAAIGLGGDEDAMDFVFDADGNLLYYYQHNQSPDWAWFCDAEGEPSAAEPNDECVQGLVAASDYSVEKVSEGSGTTLAGDAGALPKAAASAVAEYVAAQSLSPDVAIDYDYAVWDATGMDGAEVALSAEGHPAVTYVLAGYFQYGMTIVLQTNDAGLSFLCKEID